MAAQLLESIGGIEFEGKDSLGSVGASIGMAAINHDDVDVDEVMARADLACYRAKAKGRGCVVVLDTPAIPPRRLGPSLAEAS